MQPICLVLIVGQGLTRCSLALWQSSSLEPKVYARVYAKEGEAKLHRWPSFYERLDTNTSMWCTTTCARVGQSQFIVMVAQFRFAPLPWTLCQIWWMPFGHFLIWLIYLRVVGVKRKAHNELFLANTAPWAKVQLHFSAFVSGLDRGRNERWRVGKSGR